MKTTFTLNPFVKVFLVIGTLLLLNKKGLAQASDNCSGLSSFLSVGTSCSPAAANLKSMNPTSGVPGCGNAGSADVWFKFVATNAWPTITMSGIGANLKAATAVIQLLSGSCGSWTSLACISGNPSSSSNTLTLATGATVGGTGLTPGNTYYVRVLTNTNTGVPNNNGWTFTLCVTNPTAPTVDYGKSYVNITKGTVGGTVEPGDILEIRATYVVSANSSIRTAFTDNIPTGTNYIGGTLRILTNEGKIYKQFTDAADGDAGTITGTAISINMGAGATGSLGGYVTNTSKPNFYGNTCIMVASYRVQVTASYGSLINVGNGAIKYSTGYTPMSINFPSYTIAVFKNYGLCSNSVGTNALINEYGGTFGTGNIKDRAASNKVPPNYTYAAFSASAGKPNDYFYCVSNNTSGGTTPANGYATSNTAYPIPDNSAINHRIFSVWDIIGDHTGASNPLLGNSPTDDLNGISGGYMVVINAAYRTDTAFLDTVYNLCPNTYYQYTAWFRNICSRCGCDSNGTGAGGGNTYIPTAPGDSSGVYPNLTFNINGYDYYSTGDILHSGQWVQKGFTYLTGPTQTTMVVSIRNNAPGGGGNDWAIDDIGVSSCYPSMLLTPNKPDTLCQGSDDTVRFKVTAFFNNYTEWKLEKSIDNGSTWTTTGVDTTGKPASGTGVPVFNPSTNLYEYLVSRYFRLNPVDALIKYRIIVASTTANLANPNCSYITMSPKIVYAVDCNIVLPTRLLSFKGQAKEPPGGGQGSLGFLQWVTTGELDNTVYTVESSDDGSKFTAIGTVQARGGASQGSSYQFTDPTPLAGARFYRLRITSGTYSTYSTQVMVSDGSIEFAIRSLVNPFTDHISMELASPGNASILLSLVDMYGRVVKTQRQTLFQGLNNFEIAGLGMLSKGTYILQINTGDKIFSQKMMKLAK
jgi:hypothetical protein